MADEAITTQPRSKRKEVEQFVRDLDPLQVQGGPGVVLSLTTYGCNGLLRRGK